MSQHYPDLPETPPPALPDSPPPSAPENPSDIPDDQVPIQLESSISNFPEIPPRSGPRTPTNLLPATSQEKPPLASEPPSRAASAPLVESDLPPLPASNPPSPAVSEGRSSSIPGESHPDHLPPPSPVTPTVTVVSAGGDGVDGDSPSEDVFLDAEDQQVVLLRREASLRRNESTPYADTTLRRRVTTKIDRIGAAITRFLDRDKDKSGTSSGDRERAKSADFHASTVVRRTPEKRTDDEDNRNSLIPFGSNFLRRSFRQKSAEDQEEEVEERASQAVSVRNSVYNEDLVASLVCAACAHYMVGPIEQCKRGHNICKFCRRRAHQHRCPACGARLSGIRNLVAEDMARKLLFPCVHANAGCTRQVPNDELEFHEPRCPFRVYNCLINVATGVPCKWEGRRVDLEDHVRSQHPRYYSAQDTTKWRWSPNLLVKMEDFQLISAFGELFWYCASQDPERLRVCWFVQHVGYDQDTVRFEYRFVMVADEKDRRLEFRCTTLPDYSSVGSIIESGHCVDMSYQQALSFVDEDGTIKFSVSMHNVES